jgi:hypothetical protein
MAGAWHKRVVKTAYLIHSIVRQTTVLIAQLATAGGVRAPLAQIADRVFLDLASELEAQGVSRKVSADMFGMALRTYQRRIQRVSESSTEPGRSLWQAVLTELADSGGRTRQQLLERFHSDDEASVAAVLHDLVGSGLSRVDAAGVHRLADASEVGQSGADELLWVRVYREGPLRLQQLQGQGPGGAELEQGLARLQASGRVQLDEDGRYVAREFHVPREGQRGFEAAVLDHYQALVKTICQRLQRGSAHGDHAEAVGGSTYTLDVWPGHPHYERALSCLTRMRDELGGLRAEVEAHNAGRDMPDDAVRVVVYAGQCVLDSGADRADGATPSRG